MTRFEEHTAGQAVGIVHGATQAHPSLEEPADDRRWGLRTLCKVELRRKGRAGWGVVERVTWARTARLVTCKRCLGRIAEARRLKMRSTSFESPLR